MPIKHIDFIIKGMHRDLSESAFNPEYSYENQNIRITTDKNDSSEHTGDLMAMTNERGNKYTSIIGLENNDMQGVPIGQCMINNQWVVFYTNRTENVVLSEETVEHSIESGQSLNLVANSESIDNLEKDSDDKIYRLWLNNNKLYGELLYEGNLNFDYKHPIETLGYYENEEIQKVYWTDGINQPRFINIVEKPEKRAKWNDKSFDFVPEIDLLSYNITINEKQSGGKFPAGVIQWFFTYSRQFGQESSIFHQTKLYELKFNDRGAAPDEQTSQSFEIILNHLDANFDYINIYSIIRTSLDDVPVAKCIATLPITDGKARFVDTNEYGYAVDPQELLYKGGEIISAYTMENKDNTLFLGNYSLKRSFIPQEIKDSLKDYAVNSGFRFNAPDNGSSSLIEYDEVKNRKTFRKGNYYRIGIQFQHISGKWSEAVWLGDYQCDKKISYKYTGQGEGQKLSIPYGELLLSSMNKTDVQHLIDEGYVKARPLIVLPSFSERKVIATGVLCNTINFINEKYVYPDYFFRFSNVDIANTVCPITKWDRRNLYNKNCVWNPTTNNLERFLEDEYSFYTHIYYSENKNEDSWHIPTISKDFFSIYSPDIEFDDSLKNFIDNKNVKINIHSHIDTLMPISVKNEVTTSSISKPTEGHNQWYKNSAIFKNYYDNFVFNNTLNLVKDSVTTTVEKDGTSYTSTFDVGRFNIYGKNILWDYVASTDDDTLNKFIFDAVYPQRIPNNFDIKKQQNRHYVGGYIWEDTNLNISKEHSELLNKDIPTRSGAFMQYYFQYIYPVMLWQASGSICYDPSENPSSVLKSNKTINYFGAHTYLSNVNNDTPLQEPIESNARVSYGPEVLKLNNNSEPDLYSSRMDNIMSWQEEYSALVYYKPKARFDWNYDHKYSINDNWIFGTPEYNKGKIELFTLSLPYDGVTEGEDGGWREFRWNNLTDVDLSKSAILNRAATIRYNSTPHIVVDNGSAIIHDILESYSGDIIPIVNIERDIDAESLFGGNTDGVLQTNNFIIAGQPTNLAIKNQDGKYESVLDYSYVYVKWTVGDTYYQEYECLKTYPVSFEDENCVTEIIRVPIESYWNMDCRYDTWSGNPTFATNPANWNLMNPVYNQEDNFFVYHGLDLSVNSINDFPNSFTWTKTKWSGDLTDKWTHVTLASNMDVDGDKGRITKLVKLQDNLLCFQPRGLSQILYNEREQIVTGSGNPIELANSGKVSGVRYVTERTGCNNKWSICKNETGLYWVDDENKAIMAWNQQLANLSDTLGFHSWINAKSNLLVWNPIDFNSFVTYYDPYNESVMFFYKENMLSYNVQLNCFDSFFSYGYVPYYMPFNGTAFTLSDRDSDGKDTYKVWEQHRGDYNYFYVQDQCSYDLSGDIIVKGKYDRYGNPTEYGFEPYYTTLLVNPDMPYDKIFTNLDMRTDMWNKSKELLEETFSHIHVWNEFQENKSTLIRNVDIPKVHLPAQHSILKKKFRVWYVDIPRDKKHPDARFYKRDRMRNTWLYVKLSKELIDNDNMITYPYISDNKHIIHHIGVSYFI